MKKIQLRILNTKFILGIINLILTLCLIQLLTTGCATPERNKLSQQSSKKIKKVAILPFYNISGYRDAGKIVQNIFVNEMFKSGRFVVEETGNIVQFMIQEKMDSIGEIEIERLKTLGRRLGVDVVVTGTIEEFTETAGAYSVPTVSITARMIDSETGYLVWSGQNKRKGDDYILILDIGQISSITTLTQKVVREMIGTIK